MFTIMPKNKFLDMELCDVCSSVASNMCKNCELAVYCSKECQAQEWDEHQHVCWKDEDEHVGSIFTRYRNRKYRRKARKLGKERRKDARFRRKEERKDWWDRNKERLHRTFFGKGKE
jgi:hypothetical protein